MNYEREYYMVDEWSGVKLMHYMGFSNYSGECPDDWDEEEWREYSKTGLGSVDFTYPTWVMLPVDDLDFQKLTDLVEASNQYMERLVESEAIMRINGYYGYNKPGTHLPMWQVNSDTPFGCYWCYTDEMDNEQKEQQTMTNNIPKTVNVIATNDEQAKVYEEDARSMGLNVKSTSVWTGPVPPNSFVEIAPNVAMATPEYTFLRKTNQLPVDDAVTYGCALLSHYDTCHTTTSLNIGETYRRETPHTTPYEIFEYLLPIMDTAEAVTSLAILKECVETLPAFERSCEEHCVGNE